MLVKQRGIAPHIPVFEKSGTDGTFSRSDFAFNAELITTPALPASAWCSPIAPIGNQYAALDKRPVVSYLKTIILLMEAQMSWSTKDIPNQTGKLAVVTGATGGLGYQTALELARAGARVVLTGRSGQKGAEALGRIKTEVPTADVSYENLDLSALANVKAFAEVFMAKYDKLDILINNAGVMAPPKRQVTRDGLELQFETNYLSHFALTARLLPLLIAAPAARVVPLGSVAARDGQIDFSDLQSERDYKPMVTYSATKLACIMFGFELQRQSTENDWGIASISAHPGVSRTDLIINSQGERSPSGIMRRWLAFMFQPVEQGALPTLMAATDPVAKPGGYYGPQGMMETRGAPGEARPPVRSLDLGAARRLWDRSEELSGVRFQEQAIPA